VLEPKIDEFLRVFSLWEDRDTAVSEYSKGMRQKIVLSAALLHNPQTLILDEPLSGLDVNTMIAVRELLRGLAAAGKTILYCSHELDLMEKVCSRVAILRRGRIVADDTIEQLRQKMDQSSLEGVFARFTQEENHVQLASRVMQAMR
jgi:ABC-2 type transport system ATP-binding protein